MKLTKDEVIELRAEPRSQVVSFERNKVSRLVARMESSARGKIKRRIEQATANGRYLEEVTMTQRGRTRSANAVSRERGKRPKAINSLNNQFKAFKNN